MFFDLIFWTQYLIALDVWPNLLSTGLEANIEFNLTVKCVSLYVCDVSDVTTVSPLPSLTCQSIAALEPIASVNI